MGQDVTEVLKLLEEDRAAGKLWDGKARSYDELWHVSVKLSDIQSIWEKFKKEKVIVNDLQNQTMKLLICFFKKLSVCSLSGLVLSAN